MSDFYKKIEMFCQRTTLITLIIVFLTCVSCNNRNDNKLNPTKAEKTKLILESSKIENEQHLKNENLISFLKDPIDLQEFKNLKNGSDYITTNVSNGMDYYFQPQIEDSIFYTYNYLSENYTDLKFIDKIIVFKYGENKHDYDDETEILIEMRVFNKGSALDKANLIGLTKNELETKFGTNYLTFEGKIAFSNKNHILILELMNSKVESFRYLKLNTDKIDTDLIEQIS